MIGVLPKSLVVNDKSYAICSDYRVALLIFQMCDDSTLDKRAKAVGCVELLYEDYTQISNSDFMEAYEKSKWFLDGGDMPKSEQQQEPILNWEQDESLIFPALNKVAGQELRVAEYVHWWTFLGYFNEVGEGLYSAVMNIRFKNANHKKLEKHEFEFYRTHKQLIDVKRKLSAEEQAEIDFVNSIT